MVIIASRLMNILITITVKTKSHYEQKLIRGVTGTELSVRAHPTRVLRFKVRTDLPYICKYRNSCLNSGLLLTLMEKFSSDSFLTRIICWFLERYVGLIFGKRQIDPSSLKAPIAVLSLLSLLFPNSFTPTEYKLSNQETFSIDFERFLWVHEYQHVET